MVKTVQIIETIKNLHLEARPLRLKKSETGETLGLICNYVAQETLFLFGHEEGGGFCQDFIDEVLDESFQEEWGAWAYELLGVTAPEERELIAEEALYLLY